MCPEGVKNAHSGKDIPSSFPLCSPDSRKLWTPSFLKHLQSGQNCSSLCAGGLCSTDTCCPLAGTPTCGRLCMGTCEPLWSILPEPRPPPPLHHSILALKTARAHTRGYTPQDSAPDPCFIFFAPMVARIQAWSSDILHPALNRTYLKISGVLGLGGGSAA